MRVIFVIAFLFFCVPVWSQVLRGKVIDKTTEKPLENASIFISNSSIGTTTNSTGEFTISKFPSDQFDLVISYVGFETQVIRIDTSKLQMLTILLPVRENNLQKVVIGNYEKNGWERWGFLFKNNFIGTSALSDHCTIKNPQDIHFRYSEKKNLLEAFSVSPLIIINKALGYKIDYSLENFTYDFKLRSLFYSGYPLFTELKGNASQKKRWQKKRQEVYKGSLLHFMRSLYKNKLSESGFETRPLVRKPNLEKQRVKALLEYYDGKADLPGDSLNYYHDVLNQNDYADILFNNVLDYENIAAKTSSNTVSIKFNDYLQIIYTQKKEAKEYYERSPSTLKDASITSIIGLVDKEQLVLLSNSGNYYPLNLVLEGYWAWWEKIATMLPFDYISAE